MMPPTRATTRSPTPTTAAPSTTKQLASMPPISAAAAMLINADRDTAGRWRVIAHERDTGVAVLREDVDPTSRLGRALEILAAQLASKSQPPTNKLGRRP